VLLHLRDSIELQLFHDDELVRLFMFKHLALFEIGVAVKGLALELSQHRQLIVKISLEERVADETEKSGFVFAYLTSDLPLCSFPISLYQQL